MRQAEESDAPKLDSDDPSWRLEAAADSRLAAERAEDEHLDQPAEQRLATPLDVAVGQRIAQGDVPGERSEIVSWRSTNDEAADRRLAQCESSERPGDEGNRSHEAEARAMEEQYRELDESVLGTLDRKFHSDIAEGRLHAAREHPTRFQGDGEYRSGLKDAYPDLSQQDREGIVGDLRNGTDPYVDSDRLDLPQTVAHEHLHQLSSPEFRDRFGAALDEGVTEHLAREAEPGLHIKDLPEAYPEEERLSSMIDARVGPELERAYLNGDIGPMERELDSQLGNGAFEKLEKLTTEGQLNEAEKLIRGDQ